MADTLKEASKNCSFSRCPEFKVEQDGNSIVVCCNYYYYWLTSPENINPTNGNSSALSVQVLIDDNELGEACVLSDDAIKTLSFTLLDGENDDTGSLPSVTAKWQILSGESYVSLSSTEGNRIQITNENYSGSSQTVSLRISVTAKDGTNRSASSIVTLTAAALPKKKVFAKILSNGRSVSTAETLGSTASALLSYSLSSEIGNEIEISSEWDIISGSQHVTST